MQMLVTEWESRSIDSSKQQAKESKSGNGFLEWEQFLQIL